jgi:hypothetical protein
VRAVGEAAGRPERFAPSEENEAPSAQLVLSSHEHHDRNLSASACG